MPKHLEYFLFVLAPVTMVVFAATLISVDEVNYPGCTLGEKRLSLFNDGKNKIETLKKEYREQRETSKRIQDDAFKDGIIIGCSAGYDYKLYVF